MSYTHIVCRKPETVPDELPDHAYDYISVFQEANLKGTSGNPQPSVSGDGASEVQFELTPCDAYGPGNPQPSVSGDGASEVQFELIPCDAYGPGNPQPSTVGDDASEIQIELTIL